MKRFTTALIGLAVAAVFAAPAQAVPLNVTATSFTLTGFSNDPNNQDMLDVLFTLRALPGLQQLTIGSPVTFAFADVTLNELCINPSNCPKINNGDNETDHLSVTANLQFDKPAIGSAPVVSLVAAVAGSVSDAGVDFTIDFAPTTVTFGNGGSYMVDLSDLSFTATGKKTTTATITLLTNETPVAPTGNVPEPASLALMGLGMAGAAVARRRKSRA